MPGVTNIEKSIGWSETWFRDYWKCSNFENAPTLTPTHLKIFVWASFLMMNKTAIKTFRNSNISETKCMNILININIFIAGYIYIHFIIWTYGPYDMEIPICSGNCKIPAIWVYLCTCWMMDFDNLYLRLKFCVPLNTPLNNQQRIAIRRNVRQCFNNCWGNWFRIFHRWICSIVDQPLIMRYYILIILWYNKSYVSRSELKPPAILYTV